MGQILYKGFKIENETESWALKFGWNFRYYVDGERIRNGRTIEECKELIDEEIEEMKNKARNLLNLK